MGTPYAGADTYPETVTLPDNGEARTAASVNVPLQELLDRGRFAFVRAMTFVAMNWTKGGATANPLRRGCYSPKESSWYAVGPGGSNFLEVSRDGGETWENIGGNVPGTPAICDVAIDTAGNVVLVSSATATVNVGTLGGVFGALEAPAAWSSHAPGLSYAPAGESRIVHEPSAGKFVAVGRIASGAIRASYSADGATWNAGALPSAWGTATGSRIATLGAGGGRIIACLCDNTSGQQAIRTARSTDGGATWTETSFASPMSGDPNAWTRPVYNAARGEWYWAFSGPLGSDGSKVYRSTDGGATWSLVASIAGALVQSMACVGAGGLLVAVCAGGRVLYSLDRGATWKNAAKLATLTSPLEVLEGGGGFLIASDADLAAFVTPRAGDFGGAA